MIDLQPQNADVNTVPATADSVVSDQQPPTSEPEKTWTKSQIQEMMRKRVARSHNSFFNRYGVKDLSGLDALFDKSKQYDQMNSEYATIKMRNDDLMRENSFLRNNINPERYDDIIAFFKGMGLEFSEENLLKQLGTHPEWLKPSNIPAPTTTIRTMGSEQHVLKPETEAEKMARVFGN